MYKIGELSALCRIPVKTLRFYDSEGILSPVYIDDFTGYRYYSASQLADCYRIVQLKSLGFSLEEIRKVLKASGNELKNLLDDKERQLEKLRTDTENSINVLHKLKNSLKEDKSMYNIIVRKSDELTVAFTRRILKEKSECRSLLQQIRQEITGDRAVIVDYCTEFRTGDLDIGVGVELKGRLPKDSRLELKIIRFEEDTVNLVCGENELSEAAEAVNTFIAEHGYQVIGPRYFIIYPENTIEIKVPVVQLKDYDAKYMENIDVPFENDPLVIGRWKMIDCVPCKESFNPDCIKATDLNKAVKELYFLPEGEKYWCFGWTRGYLLSKCGWPDKVNRDRYEIEIMAGKEYLFIEFKAYDYYCGGKPEVWVLERVDAEAHSKMDIGNRDVIPELPSEDAEVLGTWEVCGLVQNPDEFVKDRTGKIPPEAWYWRKAVFSEGGALTNTFGSPAGGKSEEAGAPVWSWINGYVVCTTNSTAAEYIIREDGEKKYLFIQWKTGDYIYGNQIPFWYVFERA